LAHAYMIGYERGKIESIRQKFGEQGKDAFMELISYQWEFSVLNKVPNASSIQRYTIVEQYNRNSILWFSLRCPWAGTIN
jgi:hypothetical protein